MYIIIQWDFCTSRLSIQFQQCSAVVSVVFSGLSPDRGKETTFKLMRLAVSCSCPSHKYSSLAAFVNLPVAKAPLVTGLLDYYYYKSMGIVR
jgi:hypothetical protein